MKKSSVCGLLIWKFCNFAERKFLFFFLLFLGLSALLLRLGCMFFFFFINGRLNEGIGVNTDSVVNCGIFCFVSVDIRWRIYQSDESRLAQRSFLLLAVWSNVDWSTLYITRRSSVLYQMLRRSVCEFVRWMRKTDRNRFKSMMKF